MKTRSAPTKNESIKVKSGVKAGGRSIGNHNESEAPAIKIKSGVRAGGKSMGVAMNHSESEAAAITVKSGVKAGGITRTG